MTLLGATSQAADPKPAVVKPLMTEPLTGIPGKEVTVLTVEYLPGGASAAHRHDADVFVYVLEGAVVMQVDGKAGRSPCARAKRSAKTRRTFIASR